MPKRARLYALLIIAAGTMVLAAAAATWSHASHSLFAGCLVLAAAGATFKVRVPGIVATISPTCVPILFAIGTMSWQATAFVALLGAVVQCFWRARRRPTLIQVAFNGSSLMLSGCLAYAVAHSVAPQTPLVLFGVAALIFQMANSLAVATILCLLQGGSLRSVWKNCHFWSFPYQLACGAVALAWAHAGLTASLSISVLVAITLYSMSAFYGEIVARSTSQP